MDLKDQVCSLQLAKKLKELGVKQESLWYWYKNPEWIKLQTKLKIPIYHQGDWFITSFEHSSKYLMVSAFTVAELGEMLPKNDSWYSFYNNVHWECRFILSKGYGEGDDFVSSKADTEANARAKMLIYLLENKLGEGR